MRSHEIPPLAVRERVEQIGPDGLKPAWPDDPRMLSGEKYHAAVAATGQKQSTREAREHERLTGERADGSRFALRYAPPALTGKVARWVPGGVEVEDPLGAASTPCEHGKRKIAFDSSKLTILTVEDPRADDTDKRKRIKGTYPCACGKSPTVHVREGSAEVYMPHHVPPNPVRVEREGPRWEREVKGLPVRDPERPPAPTDGTSTVSAHNEATVAAAKWRRKAADFRRRAEKSPRAETLLRLADEYDLKADACERTPSALPTAKIITTQADTSVAVGVAFAGGASLAVPRAWGDSIPRDDGKHASIVSPDARALRDSGAERVTRKGKHAEYVVPSIPEGMRVNTRCEKATESLLRKAERLRGVAGSIMVDGRRVSAPALAREIAIRAEAARSMVEERRIPTLDDRGHRQRFGLMRERDAEIDQIDNAAKAARKGTDPKTEERDRVNAEAAEARERVEKEIARQIADVERLARERTRVHERIAAEAPQLVREAAKLGAIGTTLLKQTSATKAKDPPVTKARVLSVKDLAVSDVERYAMRRDERRAKEKADREARERAREEYVRQEEARQKASHVEARKSVRAF